MKAERRDFVIRDLGCTACFLSGHAGNLCEKHHLNAHDMPGGKRRGEAFTVGLCQWHHVGKCACTGVVKRCAACKGQRGPSWVYHKREFLTKYGDGDALLAVQNQRIEQWVKGTVQ